MARPNAVRRFMAGSQVRHHVAVGPIGRQDCIAAHCPVNWNAPRSMRPVEEEAWEDVDD
jgi:hypothetical protein